MQGRLHYDRDGRLCRNGPATQVGVLPMLKGLPDVRRGSFEVNYLDEHE